MSIICLICKDKLLNNAPGNQVGSLNSLNENQVVATGCGHLYHFECLQCWFRTQKKKLQNQGIPGNFADHCPTCQAEVHDSQTRLIYLLEDHRESLEKARLLEKLENLEIYSYQLEIHVRQLQQENNLLLEKALSPQTSCRNDEFAAIVKNDKVMWMKKDSPPLSAIVLAIFKKDGTLWAKIKLQDKKIRTNSRSGLFGSFRFDKKHELTVPFDEIVLEKDYKKDNIIHESVVASEPTTPTVLLPKMPSFRSSTLSLPGEYLGTRNIPVWQNSNNMQPVSSFEFMQNHGSSIELSQPIPEHPEEQAQSSGIDQRRNKAEAPKSINGNNLTIPMLNEAIAASANKKSKLEQRDYVLFTPPRSPKLGGGPSRDMSASTPHLNDMKSKHVTFADDLLLEKRLSVTSSIYHFRDHDYKNVIEMSKNLEREHNQIKEELEDASKTNTATAVYNNNERLSIPEVSTPSTPLSASSTWTELQSDVFIDSLNQPQFSSNSLYNKNCFDMAFSMLFYNCNVFDKLLLQREILNDDIQRKVQNVLAKEFVHPLRSSEKRYSIGYSDQLHKLISHLCSAHLDLEELMTILFEYVFKLPPFISYSYDMCDYIHQFFIDYTDKKKTPTVQQLLGQSLLHQDNLKLRGEPNPALFLQMPNSKDGLISHYDAVLPSLTLNIEDCLEPDALKSDTLSCYCNKRATLECATCTKIHGRSSVLFCEDCSVLLEAIHDQMYHKLEQVPVNSLNFSSSTLALTGVICLKGNHYSLFLRNQSYDDADKPKWIFIEDFEEGNPKIIELPKLEDWIESQCSTAVGLDVNALNQYQRKLLTECRMFIYLPTQNSYA